MEIKPILAANYTISYCLPELSGGWGRWQSSPEYTPPEYHQPDHMLPNGEHDIASVYMPVIGPYDSGDPDLCEYHILLAKTVGVEAFIVDWYGHDPRNLPEKNVLQVHSLLSMAEKLDFKIALCFNDAACFPPYQPHVKQREQALAQAMDIMKYADSHFFKSSAYLRLNGKPVVTAKNCGKPEPGWECPFFSMVEWNKIREVLDEKFILIQNYQSQTDGIDFSHWDSLYPHISVYFTDYDTDEYYWGMCHNTFGKDRYQFISGLVTPGYDDRGMGATPGRKPFVFSRRQGEKYSSTWEDNLRNGARFIQIGTWNKHAEGTGIEPVKEICLHKGAAVPGYGYRELITTREYAVRFTQKKIWPLTALFLPERLYRLRKSGAPASRGDRIRLYLMEGDVTGSTLGLEHAGV